MELQILIELVAQGEADGLEFTGTTGQRKEAAKTACALLDGLGGMVLFGVTDKGGITGQLVTAHTVEEVVNELRRIEPSPPYSIEKIKMDGE